MKQKFLRLFFCAEVFLFTFVYYFGPHGLHVLQAHQLENKQLEGEIAQLRGEIITLESEIDVWRTQTFYQEKMAREQLQMARAGEIVYLT